MKDTLGKLNSTLIFLIKNKKKIGLIPKTNLNYEILLKLMRAGYIESFNNHLDNQLYFNVVLRYYENQSVLHNFKRISKPGHRIYWSCEKIKSYLKLQQYIDGDFLVSTSNGILFGKECIIRNLSGEVLFKVN